MKIKEVANRKNRFNQKCRECIIFDHNEDINKTCDNKSKCVILDDLFCEKFSPSKMNKSLSVY